MPLPLLVLSPLLALPQVGATPDRTPEHWQALPLPSLAVAPAATAATPALLEGHHLLMPGEEVETATPTAGAVLPIPALIELLQEDSALRRQTLRLQPSAPPLLARGEDAALGAARALLEDLDRQGRLLDIEVTAWLTPGAAHVGGRPAPQVVTAAVQGVPPLGSAVLRTGSTAELGTRNARTFLAGYTVELASGSGVAGPAVGRILTGRTLHVRASRVRDGRGIALEGFLDLAELRGLDEFDPGTADLGRIQQPRVGVVQVAFGGVVPPGGALAVAVAGAPFEQPDWTLWVVAGEPAATGDAQPAWRARDVAFLGQPVVDLPLPRPGSVFDELDAPQGELQTFVQSLSPAEIAQAADAARAAAGRAGRTPIVWGGGLVIAPRGEEALWGEVDQLVAAAEEQLLGSSWVEVRQGGLSVVLPVLAGRPARVLVAEERAVLAGYDLQVAQDTWMPHPIVRRALDGVLVQGRDVAGRFEGTAWRTTSAPAVELPRQETGLARLQLEQRDLGCAAVRVASGGQAAVLGAAEGAAELRVSVAPMR